MCPLLLCVCVVIFSHRQRNTWPDLNDVTPPTTKCFQYADDTTLYSHCAVSDLETGEAEMNKTLTELSTWSQGSNLALNPTKTKCMLLSTSQMSTYHSLSSRPLQLTTEGKALERVKSTKLLGVHLNETLRWDDHIKHLASSCYGTLASLRKIKNFTTYSLRKHLAESLILSRLDFSDIVFYPLTERLLKWLQRIQYHMKRPAMFVLRFTPRDAYNWCLLCLETFISSFVAPTLKP